MLLPLIEQQRLRLGLDLVAFGKKSGVNAGQWSGLLSGQTASVDVARVRRCLNAVGWRLSAMTDQGDDVIAGRISDLKQQLADARRELALAGLPGSACAYTPAERADLCLRAVASTPHLPAPLYRLVDDALHALHDAGRLVVAA